MNRKLSRVIIGFALCLAAISSERTAELKRGFDFVTSCGNHLAIEARESGIASVSLNSSEIIWRKLSNKIVDVGPTTASDVVAVITDSFSAIYGFSTRDGKFLWKKELHSNVLASDGRYFYLSRPDNLGILAIHPLSGEIAWSIKVSAQKGRPLDFLSVHNGFLYTDVYVVDLSERMVVHTWPEDPYVNAISIGNNGKLLVGDSSGTITLYDREFNPLTSMQAGRGVVVQTAATNEGIFTAIYDDRTMSTHGSILLLDEKGERKWQLPLTSDLWLDPHPFVLAGNSVLLIEPGMTKNKLRMASRRLSDGNLNWATPDGDFFGPPVVCGTSVYVKEGDQIRSFSLENGINQSLNIVGAARQVKP
jgi:PQQ-like domain